MSTEARSLFLKIQPFCGDIAKTGSFESLAQLECIIDSSKSNIINDVKEYISFPLVIRLQQTNFSLER